QVLENAGDYWIGTAESCTGGLAAACLTDIAGSSSAFERGFVTYSNEAKAELLGVDPGLIALHGAVSKEIAEAMAIGAAGGLARSEPERTRMAVSVTGVAGPGGGTAEKPVGLVHFGLAVLRPEPAPGWVRHEEHRFGNVGRAKIRENSVEVALSLLLSG